MNNVDLVSFVSEQARLTKKDSEQAVSAFLDGLRSALKRKEEVNFAGFGSFCVFERAARKGRNPKTGADIQIAASFQVKFKAGKSLKDALNPKK